MHIQVKHDTLHRKWHTLSMSLHELCPLNAAIVTAHVHRTQYAIDNQMNEHMLSVRLINKEGAELWHEDSYAAQNEQPS